MAIHSAFATGFGSLSGCEFVGGTAGMRNFSALAARYGSLLGRKLVCRALFMGCPATLAGDFALLVFVHCGKTAVAATLSLSHNFLLFCIKIKKQSPWAKPTGLLRHMKCRGVLPE
jgi:hypothetical protein